MLPSYPKILALGHRFLQGIFEGPVVVQEKVDGSQFSFGLDAEGVLRCRSRGQEIDIEAPPQLFVPAVETGPLAFDSSYSVVAAVVTQ